MLTRDYSIHRMSLTELRDSKSSPYHRKSENLINSGSRPCSASKKLRRMGSTRGITFQDKINVTNWVVNSELPQLRRLEKVLKPLVFVDPIQSNIDITGQTLLHKSVTLGHYEITAFLLEKGVTVNSQDNELRTCLHIAVDKSNTRFVELLYKFGADPDRPNIHGATPRSRAKRFGMAHLFRVQRSYLRRTGIKS